MMLLSTPYMDKEIILSLCFKDIKRWKYEKTRDESRMWKIMTY